VVYELKLNEIDKPAAFPGTHDLFYLFMVWAGGAAVSLWDRVHAAAVHHQHAHQAIRRLAAQVGHIYHMRIYDVNVLTYKLTWI
jgi:hypothetical protein